jgi:hypothetical protein
VPVVTIVKVKVKITNVVVGKYLLENSLVSLKKSYLACFLLI